MAAPVTVRVDAGAGPACKDAFTVSFFLPFDHQVRLLRVMGRCLIDPALSKPSDVNASQHPPLPYTHMHATAKPARAVRRGGLHRAARGAQGLRRLVRRLCARRDVARARARRGRGAAGRGHRGRGRLLLYCGLRQPFQGDRAPQRGVAARRGAGGGGGRGKGGVRARGGGGGGVVTETVRSPIAYDCPRVVSKTTVGVAFKGGVKKETTGSFLCVRVPAPHECC